MNNDNNELPDVEVLGEWDHGLLDPVLPHQEPSLNELKKTAIRVEHKIEDAFHRVEHAVEEIIHRAEQVQAFDDELAGVMVDAGDCLVPLADVHDDSKRL